MPLSAHNTHEVHTSKLIWHSPNPSQGALVTKYFGIDLFAAEVTADARELYRRIDGISFFDATLDDLETFSQDNCKFSRHILRCLMKDNFRPDCFAMGAKRVTSYNAELGMLDLENLTWEMLLGEEDNPCPDNTYLILTFQDGPTASAIHNRPINPHPDFGDAMKQAEL